MRRVLIVMRLTEMTRVHPRQDNTHLCDKCGHSVGIYPSGQKALERHPDMIIMCSWCAGAPGSYVRLEPSAETREEFAKELSESVNAKGPTHPG